MIQPISIVSYGSISALGIDPIEIWASYQQNNHFLTFKDFSSGPAMVSQLPITLEQELVRLQQEDVKYKTLDKTVLLAILVSRKALANAEWKNREFGINFGSSRGATDLFEKHHEDFINHQKLKTQVLTSPTTTLGNITTWVANDLQSIGPTISHSITCSTALHALLNGIAWINSGMSDCFMVGASECPNTDFTVAQMKALKIYTHHHADDYPVKALDLTKTTNTMCLGEGAVSFCLEKGLQPNALAFIESVGYATEILQHNISITNEAECFQKSMQMALKGCSAPIDIVITHTPGTIKGDSSELNAISKVFIDNMPAITCNKWKIGHTLGASGGLSIEMALLMLQHQVFIPVPYLENQSLPKKIERIMVNAVGFGGNAVSVVLKRNNGDINS